MRNPLERFSRGGSPKRYRVEEYPRWFSETAEVFVRYLEDHGALGVPAPTGPAIGIAVGPWVSTTVPWYAVMLAIGLVRRGRRVVLVWDDTGYPEPHVDEQNRIVGSVLERVGRSIPVVRLSEGIPHPGTEGDAAVVDQLTEQNVVWRLRGAPPVEGDEPWIADVRAFMARTLPLARTALRREPFECVLVPGGVYGISGVFRVAAGELALRLATFDADLSVAQLSVSGVAAQNGDIVRAFHTLWATGDDVRREAIATARAEFDSRTEGTDRYGFQAHAGGTGAPDGAGAVLMPLNVEWDTAALGRHEAFTDTVDWVTSTVAEVLDADGGPVIVRQHPSERRASQRSRLDLAAVLRERFGDDPRCRFVAADEAVNTYDLLGSARLVLPYVSTIGIEAAAIGKPTLVSGRAYYADLGFVWSATTREEYLDLLRRGLRGDLPLRPEQTDRAWLCYYLTAVRNRVYTDFTAQPVDFWKWTERAPDAIFAEPEVVDILEAIDTDVPVSILRHRRTVTAEAR